MANGVENIFLLPCRNSSYVLYAPLHGVSALINEAAAQEVREALEDGELAQPSAVSMRVLAMLGTEERRRVRPPEGRYAPEHLQLFVTNACNMRCHYCLACAGDYKPTTMTEEVCRLALDFYAERLQDSGRKEMRVSYLGGEPLMAEKLLVFADEYGKELARDRGFSFQSELTTNGLMSEHQARWMAKSLSHVVVSMDGPAEIHDRYRRDIHGRGTHAKVEQTVRILEAEGARYGLCCSVDAETVGALPAMVEFMTQQYHPREVGFEPVLEHGRCGQYGIRSPDATIFVRQAVKAVKIASEAGVEVFMHNGNSGLLVSNHCCSVARGACVITCDGFVSQCCRAETRDTPGTEKFLIGRVNVQAGRVEIDEGRASAMCYRDVDGIPGCKFCFAKWDCGGGCRLFHKQPIRGESNGYLCRITREMLLSSILDLVDARDGATQERFTPNEHVTQPC